MPRMTGLQVAAELQMRRPDLHTLMLSVHDNEQYFFEALKAGASGYVLKSEANRDLIEACRGALRGVPFIHPAAASALVKDYLERARRGEESPSDPLTPRELEVIKLIAEGLTSEEHRRSPSRQHPREARNAQPGRLDPLRDQARLGRALGSNGGDLQSALAAVGQRLAADDRAGNRLQRPPLGRARLIKGSCSG
jgi:DNA-binding response OmpR family regulator